MSRLLKKLSHKYQFLELELEETEEFADSYLTEFNKYFGKFFIDKNSEMWINEETGEMRDTPPSTDEAVKRRKKDPKLKKLYKKLSTYIHPDKGGSDEDFSVLKNHYDKNNLFGLINLANQYQIEVPLEDSDKKLAESTILNLQKRIENHRNTLAWHYCTGNKAKKNQVLHMVESQLGIKIDKKDYPKELLA